MKITWVNFLHFYQPATADDETVIEATQRSYQRIISALLRNPKIKFTFNLTGCLLERWQALGYQQLINQLKHLIARGQIELVGSAAFHPILPLLPPLEIIRNIKINQQILKKYFGPKLKLKGFFSPEAAYSPRLARLIKKIGYHWLIVDEITAYGKLTKLSLSQKYFDKNSGLILCFRQRQISKSYVPQTLFKFIKAGQDKIVITATDAELYGLRHADFRGNFEKLLKRPEINTLTVGRYLAKQKKIDKIVARTSCWESTAKELAHELPFALWYNPKNKIQMLLWQLAYLAIKTVNHYQNDQQYTWARQHLDRGLSSCTFWWASARDFKLFGTLSWNPDEIERGVNELIRSIRSLTNPNTKETKIKAEKLYLKIKKLVWHKHWTYYWPKINL